MGTPSRRSGVVLGVDIGSTNLKVVALDVEGRIVARVRRPTPRASDDPSIDVLALFDVLEELVLEACGSRFAAEAVCAAGVGEDGALVDRSRQPLDHALAWFDPRRGALLQEITPGLAPSDGIGVATDAARTLVGWAWARRRPGAERADMWLALTDFASCRWSGRDFLSDTLAARTAAWRTASRTWDDGRVAATLGSPDLLPPVVRAGQVVGELRSARLREAGVLAPGAVVVAGGHDHPVGSWGVDRLSPGSIVDSMGTAEVVVTQARSAEAIAGARIDTAPAIRGEGLTLLRVEELARNVAWASQDPAVGDALRNLIAGTLTPDEHVHSTAFLPGAAGGARPRYAKDAPADPVSRASAVLGALAALGGEAIRDIAAHLPSAVPVYAAGGWARSRGWVDIKRLVTGETVDVITEPEVTATGAALLAATAIGRRIDAGAALAPSPAVGLRTPR
ncbi:FGGY family carbohydrate kinase [Prauserella endophytica]|uniref:Carbohydrate kinase FGGY N-terminal domain-containing protein n=1 Tax=Prauserella endophytica TaxID=1592324 RepID=A0ABY2RZE6_9PSEU|nr:FGGY family carbohydrate kinase [Prauserella endophytica]TKG64919.1 hypothetical protein FCN18_28165 [Prauserella endophytica]